MGVTFTSTGSNNFFTDPVGITDFHGFFTATLASTTAEVKTVKAQMDVIALATRVTFSPLASSSSYSTLVASPNALAADGVTTSTLTLTVRDTANLPLLGAPVAWAVTGSNNTFISGAIMTDANGIAMATLASTTAEVKTVTATSGAAHVSQSVTFRAGPISGGNCTFVAEPNTVTADGASVSALTFTARDVLGNGIPNASVTFSSTGSNNAFSAI